MHGLARRGLLAAQHHGVVHGRRRRAVRRAAPRAGGRLAHVGAAARAQRQDVPALLHARQAALLLHLAHHHGHPEQPLAHAHALRDLPVHHGPVPLLPPEPAALAELDPALAVVQRLLREGAAHARQAGQGLVLDAAPRQREHVRERLLPAAPEALQGREEGDAAAGAEGGADARPPRRARQARARARQGGRRGRGQGDARRAAGAAARARAVPARAHAAGAGALRAPQAGARRLRARHAPLQHHAPAARRRLQGRAQDVRRELRLRARARRQLLPVAAVPPPRAPLAAALVTVPAGVGAAPPRPGPARPGLPVSVLCSCDTPPARRQLDAARGRRPT